MNITTLKKIIKFVLIMALGAFLMYAYLWYDVYREFNDVWTCQVFTGELTVVEKTHCDKYLQSKQQ